MSKLFLGRENHPCPVGLAGSSGIPEGTKGTWRKLYLYPQKVVQTPLLLKEGPGVVIIVDRITK